MMNKNTSQNEKVALNDEREKGLNLHEVEDGRWITCWVTPEELTHIMGVKLQWKDMGLALPFSKILRQIVAKGFDQVDWKAVKHNPMALFQEAS